MPWDQKFELQTLYTIPVPVSDLGVSRLIRIADLDKDGVDDVVLGGRLDFGPAKPAAKAGLVEAFSTKTGRRLWQVRGVLTEAEALGHALLAIDDVDDDGVADVVAGAPLFRRVGRLRVLSGKNGSVLRHVRGTDAFQCLGSKLRLTSDLDADGRRDVIMGAGFHFTEAYAVCSAMSGAICRTSKRPFYDALDDVDGDGVRDVLVLDRRPHDRVILASLSDREIGTLELNAVTSFPRFTPTVVGDIDRDGLADVIVSVGTRTVAADYLFDVRVLSAKSRKPILEFSTALGRSIVETCEVRGVGDVDADGIPDIGVGLERLSSTQGNARWVALHSGRDGRLLARWIVPGLEPVGWCWSEFGDSDADGRHEIAVFDGFDWDLDPSVKSPDYVDGRLMIFDLPETK